MRRAAQQSYNNATRYFSNQTSNHNRVLTRNGGISSILATLDKEILHSNSQHQPEPQLKRAPTSPTSSLRGVTFADDYDERESTAGKLKPKPHHLPKLRFTAPSSAPSSSSVGNRVDMVHEDVIKDFDDITAPLTEEDQFRTLEAGLERDRELLEDEARQGEEMPEWQEYQREVEEKENRLHLEFVTNGLPMSKTAVRQYQDEHTELVLEIREKYLRKLENRLKKQSDDIIKSLEDGTLSIEDYEEQERKRVLELEAKRAQWRLEREETRKKEANWILEDSDVYREQEEMQKRHPWNHKPKKPEVPFF